MKKYLCLSFDDGPSDDSTMNDMLDVLEKHNVKASFFIIGNKVNADNASVVKRAVSLGCDIQNHSWTHSFMSKMTRSQIIEEYEKTDLLLEELTGRRAEFFRPPYLDVSDDVYEAVKVPFIFGKGDCKDWEVSSTKDFRFEKLISAAEDGTIYLLHVSEGNKATVDAVNEAIPVLKNMGYEFVTVPEIFKLENVNPCVPNSKWEVAK